MSIPTSALVECPNNAILYVMVLDDVEFVEIPSYSILTVKNEIMYKYRLFKIMMQVQLKSRVYCSQ